MAFKSGYIALFGRPNTGKTTLLNRLVGQKIGITSTRPQTTRYKLRGIVTTAEAQMIFIDTPGVGLSKSLLEEPLRASALEALEDADLILAVFDAARGSGEEDQYVLDALGKWPEKTVGVINKCDLVEQAGIDKKRHAIEKKLSAAQLYEVSALKGHGIEALVSALQSLLPEGPKYYPDDELTDQTARFIAAEVIREKLFRRMGEEIPYALAVSIEDYEEKPHVHVIGATIYVERDSLKGMVIGKKGSMLRQIGTEARLDLEKQFDTKVHLDLYVKVWKNWRKDPRALREFGLK